MPIQQGDTFPINFQYNEDDVATALPSGYKLIVGIYDPMGSLIIKGDTSNGTIAVGDAGAMAIQVNHQQSMRMVGAVRMELTLVGANGEIVDHANSIVQMDFEPRRNNAIL